jgi:phosphate transport system protein
MESLRPQRRSFDLLEVLVIREMKTHKVVDRHSYAVRRDVMLMLEGAHAIPALQHDPHMVQRATHLLWIVYQLGRVADHCTNICERIVFIVEGETDILTSLEE